MGKRTGLGKRLAAVVFAACVMLMALPFIMPGRSAVYAAAVKSEAKAKTIALKDAGFKEADVSFTKVRHEKDDDDDEWKIEFKKGGYTYEYTINASNGRIEDKEYEIIKVKKSSGKKQITQSKAKKLAIARAKVSGVKNVRIKKKTYRSKAKVWEVSFKKGKREWTVKLDRYSGKTLELEYEYN